MENYVIITENDGSAWNDKTGELYHFPKRYRKYLLEGTKIIYYKGSLKHKQYRSRRLAVEGHYFGIGTIGSVIKDQKSNKNDFFAYINDYQPFSKPVLAKQGGEFIEVIPEKRTTNYWRDGVRQIEQEIYEKIIAASDLEPSASKSLNDLNQGLESSFESVAIEGSKKHKFSSYYERKPIYRQQALIIHGYDCMACGFNFERFYGEVGQGFIHVHHIKPISEIGETTIDPAKDLVVLCANCHSIIHRKRLATLSLGEVKAFITKK